MSILRQSDRTTRKTHKCFGCNKIYLTGTKMTYVVYKDDEFFGAYWCETCIEYVSRHWEIGDDCGCGEIYENDPEEWDAIRKELAGGAE